ncbi:MAG TPA: NADH-quinone oxidoreductase subunit J [bacterium]|nr:NADH-quinone oxidoreductase subunit J [bacterium]
MSLVFFYVFAILTVLSAIAVIAFRNTLSSAFALVLTLFGVACLYALLEAHFLAAMQVLVYAGAVMVLFLFVIMLMNLGREEILKIKMSFAGVVGILIGGYLATILVLRLGTLSDPFGPSGIAFGTIKDVGRLMFSEYLVPFELASFLLLIAIVGVVVLARRDA